MPTYEYACTKCGQHIEVFQRMADDPLTECGACGGPLRKVFLPTGILFKGSGFYSTDNRPKEKASEGSEKKSAPADAGSSKPSSPTSSEDSSSPSTPPKEKSA